MESFEGSYNERLRSVVKKLRPIDDIFFQKFASNKGFCEELVRTVLEDERITILEHTVQCNLKNLTGRSVILDLQCRLGDGTLCNVEVQKSDNENHVRRANYNASMMETCYSLCGSTFDELPNTIVIFITEHDFLDLEKQCMYKIVFLDSMVDQLKWILEEKSYISTLNQKITQKLENILVNL